MYKYSNTCARVKIIEQNFTCSSSQGRFTLFDAVNAGIPDRYSRRSERGEVARTFRSFPVPLRNKLSGRVEKNLKFNGSRKLIINISY